MNKEELYYLLDNAEKKSFGIIKGLSKFILKQTFSIFVYSFLCLIYLGIYSYAGFERTIIIMLVALFNMGILKYIFQTGSGKSRG